MKCKSCEGDVPPKFAHSIAVNCCPLCGNEIMEAELQSALTELKSAMSIAKLYPDEVFDWLKSNYSLIPQSSVSIQLAAMESTMNTRVQAEMDKFKANYFKATPANLKRAEENSILDQDGNQVVGETIQAPEQTNKFMKNAGVNKMVSQNDRYREIVKEIKKNGAPALMSEGGGAGVISPDMLQQAWEAEDTEEMGAYFGNGPGVSSGLDSDMDGDDEGVPAFVLSMANQAKQSNGGTYNPKDVAALQQLHGKARRASNALNNGGSVGLIKR